MWAGSHYFPVAKYIFTMDDADTLRDHFIMLGSEREKTLSPRLIGLLDRAGYSYDKMRDFFLTTANDFQRSLVLQAIIDGTRTPYFERIPQDMRDNILSLCAEMLNEVRELDE